MSPGRLAFNCHIYLPQWIANMFVFTKINKPSMKMTLLSPGMLDTRFSTSAVEQARDAVPMMNSTGHLISPMTFLRGLCFLLRGRPRQIAPRTGSTLATCRDVRDATPHPTENTFLESCLERAVVTAECTPGGVMILGPGGIHLHFKNIYIHDWIRVFCRSTHS